MATYSAGEASVRITPSLLGFAAGLRRDLERIQVEFDVDITGDLTRLRQQLATFRERVTVDVDGDLTLLRARLAALQNYQISVGVNADTAAAEARLDLLTRNRTVDVDINVRGGGLGSIGSSVGRIGQAAGSGASSLGGMSSALTSMAGATAGIMGVASAIAAIGGAAGVAGGAVGALAIGLSSVGVAGAGGISTLLVGLNGVGDAFSAVGAASSGAGGAAEDTAKAVTSAERTLASAVKDEQRAQEDVARARRSALEQLQDYNLELKGAALSEQDAVLSLAEAKRDLAKGDFDDPLERQRAVLSVAEAEQRLAEVRESNGDLEEKAADARQKGVDQADQVVTANDRLTESQQRVADAQQALADAQTSSAGGGGIDKAAEAMAKLSPNAREFVTAMTALKPAWDAVQNSVQDRMFEGLSETFTNLANTVLPTLQQGMGLVAGSINGAAQQFAAFWSSAGAQEGLLAVFAGTADFIAAIQPGIAGITSGFLSMAEAMAPVMTQIGAGFGTIFSEIGAALASVDTSFFSAFAGLLGNVGVLLGDVVRTLTELGTQVMPALGPFLVGFGEALVAMAGPVGNLGAALLEGLTPVLPVLAQLINAMAEGLAPILPILSEALQTVGNALIESLPIAAPVILQLVELFNSLLTAVAPLLPPLIQLTAAILTPLIGIFQQIVTALAPFIEQLTTALTPVITALAPVIAQVGQIIADALTKNIETLMPLILPFVQAFADMMIAIAPLIPSLLEVAAQILPLLLTQIRVLLPVITAWMELFTAVANTIIMPILIPALNILAGAIGIMVGVVDGFLNTWNTVWQGVQDKITEAKDWVSGRIDEVVGFVSGLGERIGNAASGMWDGIKDAFKNAINWIIEKWNNLELKMPEIKIPNPLPGDNDFKIGGQTLRTPDIAKLAGGGNITGPGGPRDDQVLIAASNGEYIINAASTRAYRPLIEAINSGSLPKFADGGEISDFPRKEGLEGSPYDWGGVHWGDCSGAMSAIARFAVGLDPWGGRFSTGTQAADLASMGFSSGPGGPGDLRFGWFNGGPYGGHTAGTLPDGTNVEMGGGRGDGQVGGPAAGADDSQFTDHAYLTIAGAAPWVIPGGDYQSQTPGADNVPGWGADGSTSDSSSGGGSTGSSGSGSRSSSSPTSWSQVAGIGASAFASGMVSDLLGVFGIPDAMPPAVQAYNQLQQNRTTPAAPKDPGTTGKAEDNKNFTPGAAVPAPSPVPQAPPAPVVDSTPQGAVKRAFQPLGWDTGAEWDATDWIVGKESGWDPLARNPSSGAFGLFQFLGTTKDQYLPDENPDSFIQGQAGGAYIGDRYETPLQAKAAWEAQGWYADGGYVSGAGGPRTDSIPAYLSDGEFVINAAATRANMPILEAINAGRQVGGGDTHITNNNVSTARVEDAFWQLQHLQDKRAAMSVGRFK